MEGMILPPTPLPAAQPEESIELSFPAAFQVPAPALAEPEPEPEPQLPLGPPTSEQLGRTVVRVDLVPTPGTVTTVTLAGGAHLVKVGIGRNGSIVHAWFDTYTGPIEVLGRQTRRYRVFQTGDAVPLNGVTRLEYRGTAADPSYVREWHVYEEL